MTTVELQEIYTTRKKSFQKQLETVQKKSISVSWLRVLAGVGFIAFIYFSFPYSFLWAFVVGSVILYAYLVIVYEKLSYQKSFLQNLIKINEGEFKAQQGDHNSFDDGSEFLKGNHPYSADLDIFGKGSIFQRMNRTCTEPGKERLSVIISEPVSSPAIIIERQNAVKEFSEMLEFRQHFQAIGMSSSEKTEDQKSLLDWLDLPAMVYGKKKYRVAQIVFPILSLAALIYWIVSGFYGLFALITLVQWAIVGFHGKKISLFQDYIGKKRNLLDKFSRHFSLLQDQSFHTAIGKKVLDQSVDAATQLEILAGRSRMLDARLNVFIGPILNGILLFDLFSVYRLEQWREKNRDHLPKWLEAIQEADAINSLGSFAFNNPEFVFPEIVEADRLEASSLGHPLLPLEGRVCNDISMDKNSHVWIVTGANMAGKSTFLRSVGVNVVLALTGSVVCASRMVCPTLEVYTGMRTTDSINDHQSYFFAELLRLQMIIEKLRSGKRLLILLDEILKGTNSADKLTGSEELVKQLVDRPCFTMVATHDIALGEMQKQFSQLANYHFETFINGDELSFDYKLKSGVSTGKNATFLMKRMGIIAD